MLRFVYHCYIGLPRAGSISEIMQSAITEEEEAILRKYLPKSVTAGTELGYRSGFDKWKEYLKSLPSGASNDLYLDGMRDDRERAKRVVLFMAYLYEVEGLRDEQINRAITCVSYYFSVQGLPTGFLGSALIARGRKAGVRTTEEARALEEKRTESMKLPAFIELIWQVRKMCWEGKGWSADDMDSKALWLANGLAFDSGPRISNVTLKDGKNAEDHCIRAGHVAFTIVDPVSGKMSRVKGGPLLSSFLKRNDVEYSMVKAADLVFLSSKTSKRVKSIVKEPKTIARDTWMESTLLDDIIGWVHYSGVQEEDELLTRYCRGSGSRKVVIRKDVTDALKQAAEFFGLPKKHFSSKSCRSGFGTHAKANGMSSSEVNKRGGWTEGSVIPDKHYVRNMHSRGAFALSVSASGDQMHGIVEVRRMLPALSNVSSV
jgi:hypothetical protein